MEAWAMVPNEKWTKNPKEWNNGLPRTGGVEATYPREMEAFTTESTLLGDQGGKSSGVGKAIRLS
jgi:hypothetical protein